MGRKKELTVRLKSLAEGDRFRSPACPQDKGTDLEDYSTRGTVVRQGVGSVTVSFVRKERDPATRAWVDTKPERVAIAPETEVVREE